jgi:parvulin-like peptidyl-prolyl isomerase
MDAANPLSRCIFAAALSVLAAFGCKTVPDDLRHSEDRLKAYEQAERKMDAVKQAGSPATIARPQAPTSDPLPPAPPIGPQVPSAVIPAAPVQGQPVTPSKTVPVGYSSSGAGALKSITPQGIPALKIVAVVGGSNVIYDQEVIEAVRQRMQEYISIQEGQIVRNDAKEKALYYEELRRIIERELILDEMYTRLKNAKKLGLVEEIKDMSAKQANRQLAMFKKAYGAKTDEDFEAILVPQGLTLPVIRRQLERQMMAEEYVRSSIREKIKGIGLVQIREYYDSHAGEFKTEDRVKWLDIFISFGRFPNAKAASDHAATVQQKAAGGADFLALVKEFDNGVAANQNGEGIGSKHGDIRPAEVEATLWAMKPGQVSSLIETPAGYHIVKVAERDFAGTKPFDEKVQDEVRKKLTRDLMDAEYKKLVEQLWRGGVVKVLIDVPK